ncbi:fish-egg lectin-like [Salarias fasciatus]|uniref:fish-egg lectin-like n=1 Tax=Salarias fasciatus TaxID=181472 RepID=UPI00117668D1|nr:fish-egg lectin-like [Salarias fasciatus]XP_029968777.1 fish-egg lectin-like [Salarias fasciatus]
MKSAAVLFLVINCLSRCHGWTCDLGPQHSGATQIDAGQGQVVMRNDKSEAFVLSGSTWTRLGSLPIRHISVGPAGIWGVDSSDKVYRFGDSDFLLTHGQNLNQVDAGGQDKIAGVTSSSTIHCLSAGASPLKEGDSLTWTTFPGALMYISCSSYGCWGVNSGQQIYFTKTDSCQIRGWTRVEGAAIMVEVGTDGTVFVVNVHGNLYQRTGISADVPHGTGWFQIPLSNNIKHASYDLGNLWLVINGGIIAKCSQ